jgi:hypothetical protein
MCDAKIGLLDLPADVLVEIVIKSFPIVPDAHFGNVFLVHSVVAAMRNESCIWNRLLADNIGMPPLPSHDFNEDPRMWYLRWRKYRIVYNHRIDRHGSTRTITLYLKAKDTTVRYKILSDSGDMADLCFLSGLRFSHACDVPRHMRLRLEYLPDDTIGGRHLVYAPDATEGRYAIAKICAPMFCVSTDPRTWEAVLGGILNRLVYDEVIADCPHFGGAGSRIGDRINVIVRCLLTQDATDCLVIRPEMCEKLGSTCTHLLAVTRRELIDAARASEIVPQGMREDDFLWPKRKTFFYTCVQTCCHASDDTTERLFGDTGFHTCRATLVWIGRVWMLERFNQIK